MTFNVEDIPPTSRAVLVKNLSPQATEKAVKDFFTFCGKVQRFEMVKVKDSQEAFVLFDKDSAANTARLLTNAVIMDRSIVVTPFFEDTVIDKDPLVEAEENTKEAEKSQLNGHKPLSRVVAELLANGYTLTEPVVKKGLELENKYSVRQTLTSYFFSAQARALEMGEKYKVTPLLRGIDAKFGLVSKGNAALALATGLGESVLNTSAGQKVKSTVEMVSTTALAVASETRQIVDERHRAQEAEVH